MSLENKFRVAIFDEFLDAFARIPRSQQKKVSKFMRQFRANPTSASINYESITAFKDPNLRTVRIDKAYRAIVLKPNTGNVFVLLWVDNHDEAMNWARNKRVVIHPDTGSLQVLTSVTTEAVEGSEPAEPANATERPAPASASAVPSGPPLFEAYTDEQLSSVGVHPDLVPLARAITSPEHLDALSERFPAEIYEALFFLGAGEPIEAIRAAMGISQPAEVDTTDFEAALDKAATQRRFSIDTDDEALNAMIDAPLDKWRVFLHPSQRRMVTGHFNGPARVLGGAGTGKTVVAMHRARHLLTHVYTEESDRLLFTTFTNNLARDIEANLEKFCAPELMRRVEVVHLDKWVADFLKRQGYRYTIAYFSQPKLQNLWDQALALRPKGFSATFFREEWDYVVQPAGCTSWEDYRKAKRRGRGVRLSRQQRRDIWPVFEEYRNLLDARGLREAVDAMRDAAGLLEGRRGQPPYRAVVIDEAQDMSTVAFELLRKIAGVEHPNDLFIVGDGHQRIYRRKVVLSRAGVNIVGRSRKLYINYRTTDEIRKYAVALLRDVDVDDLDGGVDSNSRYKSLARGRPPQVQVCTSFTEEVEAIRAYLQGGELNRTCLVTRTNGLLDQYEAALTEAGVPTYRVSRATPEDPDAPGVRLATMHRVKGLEYERVIAAGVKDGVVPLSVGDLHSPDSAVRAEGEKRERALFYVALTRAKRDVLITSHGRPSPWLSVSDPADDGTS